MAKLPINAEISLFLRNDLTNVESRHDSAIQVNLMALAALDYVQLTHLDCDHANGMRAVKDAKRIIVTPVVSRTVNGCQLHREPCHSRHRHQSACDRVVRKSSFEAWFSSLPSFQLILG